MSSVITSGGVDVRMLAGALADRVDGEVRFDDGSRAAYSTDASNYRQVPIGVVIPHTVEAAVEAIAACREFSAPVFSRGGGTSLAGECTNHGVVIDWSKYCNRVLSVDPDARVAVVEPGIVLDDLNAVLAPHGLQFGPKPATHSHCTLGGMIGNNSCGSSAQAYGKTVDNVRRMEVLTYQGDRFWAGPTSPGSSSASSGPAAASPSSTPRCASSPTRTGTSSGNATRASRAGSPGTTSTRCCPRPASTWARRWSAPSPPSSPCCTPNSTWCRCPPPAPSWYSASRASRTPPTPPRRSPSTTR
ncbi:FAD-binding oxidoreductase [Leifsonia sp. L25]|uniref:FAD-binding oxidoreductase n=1 Tax=Leifsonia sp. L25 TaxID=3423957 RepID=UPI003D69C0D9